MTPDSSPNFRLPAPSSHLRHYGGFLLAGALALVTDGLILEVLIRTTGFDALFARPFAIAVAMVVSWLVNRTVTFAVMASPSLREFGRFAAVSWTSQAVNYLLFATVLIARPATPPLAALVFASLGAMFVSYFGFRYGVFRHPGGASWRAGPPAPSGEGTRDLP
jgi:putative flippase GtrA